MKIKKMIRVVLYLPASMVALLLLYLGSAYVLSHSPHTVERDPNAVRNVAIYLISNGVHTDIAMPMTHRVFDWRQLNPPHDTPIKPQAQPQYIAIGWGDRDFYINTPTWADLTFSTAFYAITGLGQSAIRVSHHFQEMKENENIVKIMISEHEYRQLVQQIQSHFKRHENGTVQRIRHNSGNNNETFYESHGRYHLFQTCNTWTNTQLKASGLPAVKWTPFAQPLIDHHRHHQK